MNVPLLIGLVTALTVAQSTPPRMDIPAIAKAANGAVVSIIMSDKDGQPIAQGSGFVVSKDGRIITNYHVIKTGSSAIVKLPDGAFYVVDGVLAFNKGRDVAMIKAHGENFRTLALGNSDHIQVGDEVVAIGNPLSLESTVSNGIVSGIRTLENEGRKFLQVTAPISPGSSGGPLFNIAGEVIGITTSGIRGGENLNFAIPVNDVKHLPLAGFSKVQDFPNEKAPAKIEAVHSDPHSRVPTKLSETLQWLTGASEKESGDGFYHHSFESEENSCAVTITETRTRAGPGFWIRVSFSLADIDPEDIRVEDLGKGAFKQANAGQYAVLFHTTNYTEKIIETSSDSNRSFPGSDYTVFTNDWFAPKFARALRRAVELCGGKRSSF